MACDSSSTSVGVSLSDVTGWGGLGSIRASDAGCDRRHASMYNNYNAQVMHQCAIQSTHHHTMYIGHTYLCNPIQSAHNKCTIQYKGYTSATRQYKTIPTVPRLQDHRLTNMKVLGRIKSHFKSQVLNRRTKLLGGPEEHKKK